VAKSDSFVEVELLEHIVRDQLNQTAKRRMAVLQPLKVVLTNYPEEQVEYFEVPDFPQDPEAGGSRKVPFGRELWIERDDFAEVPPPKYHRLSPGKEVRLMNAYFVTCADVVKDQDGNVIEIHCTYDPETRGGSAPDGRKVKGTIHWVSAAHAIEAEVRIYDQMFLDEYPEDLPEGETFLDNFNHDSLQVVSACLEPDLANAQVGEAYQFVRDGYFALDNVHTQAGKLVFNRTIGLVDSWAKIHK
jgi:glutaminyl-tRNA synthetase